MNIILTYTFSNFIQNKVAKEDEFKCRLFKNKSFCFSETYCSIENVSVNLWRKFQLYRKLWVLVILDSPYLLLLKLLLCERNRDPWFQRPVNLLANFEVCTSSLASISLDLLFPMMHYAQLVSDMLSAILDMHPAGNSEMSRFCSFSSFQRLYPCGVNLIAPLPPSP